MYEMIDAIFSSHRHLFLVLGPVCAVGVMVLGYITCDLISRRYPPYCMKCQKKIEDYRKPIDPLAMNDSEE